MVMLVRLTALLANDEGMLVRRLLEVMVREVMVEGTKEGKVVILKLVIVRELSCQ